MITEKGIIKRTAIEKFQNIRKSGLIAIKVDNGDDLKWVKGTSGSHNIILITEKGQATRFSENDLRPMGRAARGVRGIRLRKDDKVIGMGVIQRINKKQLTVNKKEKVKDKKEELDLLIVTENGYGKKTGLENYKQQRRGGIGIKTANITEKTGPIVVARIVEPNLEDLIAISQKGQVIRTPLGNISRLSRVTQGVKVMRLGEEDKVASVTCV